MKSSALLLRLMIIARLSLLLANGACQQELHPSTSVDYTPIDNGTPRVLVHLDEKITANLLIDSGASECFISNTIKNMFNLTLLPFKDATGLQIFVAGQPLQLLSAPCLKVGLIEIEQCPFVVLPPDAMENVSLNASDGLIGTNFLLNYATLFDTQNKKLTFWPGGRLNADDLKSVGLEKAVVLPVTFGKGGLLGKDGLYRVHVRFNDKEEEDIALDTGASLTALPLKLVRKLKLKDTARGKPQYTLFGTVTTNEARLQTLAFGTLTVKDVDVQYQTGRDTPGFFPHIGMDVLSHFRFLLDAPARKIYLKPIEAMPEAEPPKPTAPDSKP